MTFLSIKQFSLALFSFNAIFYEQTNGCTMIAVGKNATVDGSTLMAHTDDAGGGAADVRLVNVPAMDYPKGSMRPVYNFFSGYPRIVSKDRGPLYFPKVNENITKPLGYIPQVEHTYAYFDQDYGMMNEVQLAIGESTCAAKTVGWASDVPYGYNMFGIAELSKVALERCDSARCAVKTMGELAVKYGFYSEDSGDPNRPGYSDSAETVGISDKYGEIWVFHVLTGPNNSSAIWAAQRVPDGHVSAVANAFVIREMDLDDSDNFMASDNVMSFAQEMGWWNPKDGPFDFTAAYTYNEPGPLLPLYAGRRIWRIFDVFAPSLKLDSTLGFIATKPTYPFSVQPDFLVNITTLMELLKDHYEGTPYDMTKGIAAGPFNAPIRYDGPTQGVVGGWERPISMYRTMFSFILQSRGWLPDAIGGVAWYGQDAPHGTVYVPFSCAQTEIPESYLLGKQSEYHPKSAWWAFNFVNNWSMLRYNKINLDVKQESLRLQQEAFQLRQQLEATYEKKQHEKNMTNIQLIHYIQEQSNNFATKVVNDWWAFAWRLVAKYSDGYITTGENPSDMKIIGYPSWWLQLSEFSKWPGNSFKAPKDESTHSRKEIPTKNVEKTSVTSSSAATTTASSSLRDTNTKMAATHVASGSSTSTIAIIGYILFGAVIGAVTILLTQRYRHSGYQTLN